MLPKRLYTVVNPNSNNLWFSELLQEFQGDGVSEALAFDSLWLQRTGKERS